MAKLFKFSKSDHTKERRNVSSRITRPAHFLFKIDSFTKLSEILDPQGNYESPEFECGGHNWKLSLYPRGNEKLGGSGYISLYLVTSEAGIDSLGADGISAMFKLFIFDQKHETYLTVQDDEVRKFHSLRKEWGFTRMISRKTFKNVKNGYLVDDCCVFGVEILVIPRVVKSASFSLIKPRKPFIWKIDDVSSVIGKNTYSVPFTVDDHIWKLRMNATQDGIKLFLVLHEPIGNSNFYVDWILKYRKQNCLYGAPFNERWSDWSSGVCIWNGESIKDTITFEFTIQEMSKIITT